MKPQVNAKIKLTLPVGPGELLPVAVDAKIVAIYEDGFHGLAGTTPKVIPEGKTDKKVSYNVDAETLDGTRYKYVSYAGPDCKCWHWCWPTPPVKAAKKK